MQLVETFVEVEVRNPYMKRLQYKGLCLSTVGSVLCVDVEFRVVNSNRSKLVVVDPVRYTTHTSQTLNEWFGV